MIRTVDLRDQTGELSTQLPRAKFDVDHAVEVVRPIVDQVRAEGEQALRRLSEQFDHVVPTQLRVPTHLLVQAEAELDDELRAAFLESIQRRRLVCEQAELEHSSEPIEVAPGALVQQRILPVDRVGLYVPGGLAPLASTVIMNVVPAQVAQVRSIAVASPPQAEFGGYPHPSILALCHLLGVDEVYAVGGAQAVAMFALGVDGLCPKVDMVTGPGNIYVVAAKRLLRGVIGVDSEAGPTEIAVLADAQANPRFVAADLISQAEHDPMAASVLITDSESLAQAVRDELDTQIQTSEHAERITTALDGEQSAIVLVRDLDQGIEVANSYGAEHLEIQTADPQQVAGRITSAGAIFLGAWSPVSLGDYSAGSTHVLPTVGTSAHSSGLTVRSFMRAVHIIDYSQQALADLAERVEVFARAENLHAHAQAITVRRDASNPNGVNR